MKALRVTSNFMICFLTFLFGASAFGVEACLGPWLVDSELNTSSLRSIKDGNFHGIKTYQRNNKNLASELDSLVRSNAYGLCRKAERENPSLCGGPDTPCRSLSRCLLHQSVNIDHEHAPPFAQICCSSESGTHAQCSVMTSDQKVEFLKARTEAGENAKTPTKNVFPYPLALSKEKEVDLSKCPQKVVQHREGQYTDHDYVTLGDLHGNSAKLIYFLVKEGIATFEPAENCQKTLDYYYSEKATHFPLDPEMVTLIDSIKIKKSPEVPNVRLIGDELSDRGRNDGITIEILKKISASQPRFEIMVSNHGVDFLGKIVGIEGPMSLDGNFTRSFTPLIEALKKKEKDKRDRDALRDLALFVKDVYLKHLKLVSATPQKESGPVVYTHAPTEPSLVYRAMVSLGLGIGSCKSPGDVEQNILLCSQRLNNKYRELLTEMLIKPDHANNVLQPVFNLKKESSNGKSRKHPLEELYWRRHEDWKKARRTGSWLTANGHDDGTGSTFGLDNYLGKDDSPLGIYQVLRPVVPKTIE